MGGSSGPFLSDTKSESRVSWAVYSGIPKALWGILVKPGRSDEEKGKYEQEEDVIKW